MGHSLTPINFCDDRLAIRPHTASSAKYIDKRITLRKFAGNRECSVSKRDDNGEFIFSLPNRLEFVEGPVVK